MANAALHGIEQHIARTCKGAKVIRYADGTPIQA